MSMKIGISTCPNDTFAFHALLTGEIETPGLELEFELADVEELNQALRAGQLDVSKGSFLTAFALSDSIQALPVGAALGFGVGPVLLAASGRRCIESGSRVLVPGAGTTAHLLYEIFHGGEGEVEQCVFSDITPRLIAGEADFGVCIHEARFTFKELGLELIEDLGESWEKMQSCPLPLGGIFARKDLPREQLALLVQAIQASITYAFEHTDRALVSMRAHAQEQSDEVLLEHVKLYVNDWTRELGTTGPLAIERLQAEAGRCGLIAASLPTLEIYSP